MTLFFPSIAREVFNEVTKFYSSLFRQSPVSGQKRSLLMSRSPVHRSSDKVASPEKAISLEVRKIQFFALRTKPPLSSFRNRSRIESLKIGLAIWIITSCSGRSALEGRYCYDTSSLSLSRFVTQIRYPVPWSGCWGNYVVVGYAAIGHAVIEYAAIRYAVIGYSVIGYAAIGYAVNTPPTGTPPSGTPSSRRHRILRRRYAVSWPRGK